MVRCDYAIITRVLDSAVMQQRLARHIVIGLWTLVACGLIVFVGCEPKAKPNPAPVVTTPAVAEQVGPVVLPPPDRETWSVIYMQDKKVGHSHVTVRKVRSGSEELIHTQNESELTVVRERDRVTQRLNMQTWETPAGELQRFQSRMTMGTGEMTAEGKASERGLVVTTNTLGKTITKLHPWIPKAGGYFAVDQSLQRTPLKTGETRIVTGLIPVFNQLSDAVVTALEEEDVSLRGLKQKLLKVQTAVNIEGQTLNSFCWVNDRGEILKTYDPTFKQETFLTTKEFALQKEDLGTIDLLEATTAKLKGELPKERPLKHAVYLAKLTEGQKIDWQFANDEFQQFKKIDDHTGQLTITLLDRNSKVDEALRGPQPVPEDLAANSLIQSDDPLVKQLAASLAPDDLDPLAVALALEKGVRQHIHKRGYAQAFATAAEVARTQEGDCTEHAVLLAAVCRARKIPARVALGLVYYPPQQGFAYHMWNEVWVGERWVPLDATVAQGAVGADHIKLRHANLHGESAYAVMLPLMQVVGRLELEFTSQ
jgi:hypothetical protein